MDKVQAVCPDEFISGRQSPQFINITTPEWETLKPLKFLHQHKPLKK